MKLEQWIKGDSVGDTLKHLAITGGILFFIAIAYFYIYLPNTTNHGESVSVPDFTGIPSHKLDSAISASQLRFEVSDTAYNEDFGPLEITQQIPKAGSVVKPNRKIYLTVNRLTPPTVVLPAVEEISLINATHILRGNELKLGKVIYMPSPFNGLVLEMQVAGTKLDAGTKVPKGTYIDLVVGDGAGPMDMVVGNLVGLKLDAARKLLAAINLNQGELIVPDGADTTEVEIFVLMQAPKAGDSVRIGDPVKLWIGPADFVLKDTVATNPDF